MSLPSSFRPKDASQFIGPAGKWAAHLEKLVRLALPTGDPFRILLTGPPAPPTEAELLALLRLRWPEIPKKRAIEIATFALGNVGQALTDADNAYAEYAA